MRHLAIIALGVCAAISMACTDPVSVPIDIALSGTIRDSATLAGIPGATVVLYRAQGFTRSEILGGTIADASGHYALVLHMDRCFDSLIALAVDAPGYQGVLRGYGLALPEQSLQCRSSPQTLNFALKTLIETPHDSNDR